MTAWRPPFPPPAAADLIEDVRDEVDEAVALTAGVDDAETPEPTRAGVWPEPDAAALPLVLVVCTGNLCRSQMGAAMLARQLQDRALVVSAGTDAAGIPLPGEVVEVMSHRGFDLAGIRSIAVTAAMVDHADVIVTMETGHVARLSAGVPEAFAKTFTLRELVRRGQLAGVRAPGQALASWVAEVHRDRRPADLFATRGCDEVADPYRRGLKAYQRCASELSELNDRLVALGFPES